MTLPQEHVGDSEAEIDCVYRGTETPTSASDKRVSYESTSSVTSGKRVSYESTSSATSGNRESWESTSSKAERRHLARRLRTFSNGKYSRDQKHETDAMKIPLWVKKMARMSTSPRKVPKLKSEKKSISDKTLYSRFPPRSLSSPTSSASNGSIDRSAIHLVEQIGEGYYGVVYKAKWNHLHVAAKFPKALPMVDAKKFSNEIATLKRLRHPNIVAFLGATSPPDPVLVTELLHGSLYAALHKRGHSAHLAYPLKRRIITDVVSGLAYLHAQSIIHRDLSSSNILLTGGVSVIDAIARSGCGSIAIAKVGDFGLSRAVTSENHTHSTGNCFYLAPEVFRGDEYTDRADCYSLGVVVWEILAQRIPYAGMNPQKCAYNVAERGLRLSLNAIDRTTFRDLVQDMQAADPELRPSAAQALEQIENKSA